MPKVDVTKLSDVIPDNWRYWEYVSKKAKKDGTGKGKFDYPKGIRACRSFTFQIRSVMRKTREQHFLSKYERAMDDIKLEQAKFIGVAGTKNDIGLRVVKE